MIPYPRSSEASAPPGIRILGIGNAGVHLADRLTMAGETGADIMVMNTDAQSLTSSVVSRKLTLGPRVTRGLGAGGDPEVGVQAAGESRSEIRDAVEGVDLLFLCVGLGGGTGSGIAPLVAEMARESGATVFALVTSPFSFEGRRRQLQAENALADLGRHAQVVLHFENDRMAELAAPRSGIEETFAAADATLMSCLNALTGILQGGVPMPVGLADLLAAVGGGSARALFGHGESTGDNRAHEALESALKSPFLDRGRLLNESHAVLVHLSGPPSFAFAEVAAIMREVTKHTSAAASIFLGVTTATDPTAPVRVSILGNFARAATEESPAAEPEPESKPEPKARARATAAPKRRPKPAPTAEEPEALFPEAAKPKEKPVPVATTPGPEPKPRPRQKPAAKPKQETLQFESVARGRFEKSEPTIVEGEDLDVPTFLRMRGKN